MPLIQIKTLIKAPIEKCFDLARNIDVHMQTTSHSKERAIAGTTQGLIDAGEFVTWEAVHFGIRQRLTVTITECNKPYRFVDEMVSGSFKEFTHIHEFYQVEEGTLMTDIFQYRSPFGFIGIIADKLFLKTYMTKFLYGRNQQLKKLAESIF